MPSIQVTSPVQPFFTAAPASKPQQPAVCTQPAKNQAPTDSATFKTLKTGSTTANVATTLVTLPSETIKASDTIVHVATLLQARSAATAGSKAGVVLAKVAGVSSTAAKGGQLLAKAASVVMQVPLIGKLTQPAVATTVNQRVMPVVNAFGTGLGVIENTIRFRQATAQGNTAGQVVSGLQIGLNTVSGVTGFIKGRGQAISAVAGLSSLLLDGVSFATGLGKPPKAAQVSPKP